MLRLIMLPATAETGDVTIARAGAEGHNDPGLLPCLLYILHRFTVLDADRSLDDCHVHLRDMPNVGKSEAVDEVGIVVQDFKKTLIVIGHGHEAAGTAAQVYMPELDLVCHWFRLLCSFHLLKQFHNSSRFPSVSRITVYRITVYRIIVSRISVSRISVSRISVSRISVSRISVSRIQCLKWLSVLRIRMTILRLTISRAEMYFFWYGKDLDQDTVLNILDRFGQTQSGHSCNPPRRVR
ncbi:Nitrogen regulatory protein P-II [Methanosarcina vacuolata Z-761]|uniref:Nitrogen regulatory protein P-II n=1 Tax=Methanosarcina vacuolata Z-761 TaxID=1434123 RepID=A0A0E3Q5M4_9EURY|nr:Nitrogen regulatory protein P-II [Methanosarcina vacuolata Z-761]